MRQLARRFSAAGLASPDLDARLMVLAATGLSHAALIAAPGTVIAGERLRDLEAMAERRLARQPVSRILGRREFYGREFALSGDTLDPRPDTETLIDHVLDWAKTAGRTQAPLRLLDLGTGSGILVLTLLAELPHATGTGSDISSGALNQARANADMLGISDRVVWLEADWCRGLGGRFDVIVSNPPYIPADDLPGLEPEVRLSDPPLALDGGADGLEAYRAIARDVLPLLAGDGLLGLEVGAGQSGDVQRYLLCRRFQAASLERRNRPRPGRKSARGEFFSGSLGLVEDVAKKLLEIIDRKASLRPTDSPPVFSERRFRFWWCMRSTHAHVMKARLKDDGVVCWKCRRFHIWYVDCGGRTLGQCSPDLMES